MFAIPNAGWSFLTINKIPIGSISYVDDVPSIFIKECIRYLNDNDPNTRERLFNVEFDAEGHDIGIVQIGDWDFFSFDTRNINKDTDNKYHFNNLIQLNDIENFSPKDFVYEMLKEAISDFEKNLITWADDWYISVDTESKDDNRKYLKDLINKGKETIKKYEKEKENYHEMELGNFLFGNSRGDFPIPDRTSWQDAFVELFIESDLFDGYGYYKNNKNDPEHTTNRGGYENDIFIINPYYWGDDEIIAELPNFVYKPTGFEIQWYKYPMRDSYMNQNISLDAAIKIWKECIESM